MKKIALKTLSLTIRLFLGTIGFILLYLIIAIILSCIPCNRDFKYKSKGIEIYILSNGVHTDLVLPAKNECKDWTKQIRVDNTFLKDPNINFMAFGWGDKGFYLDTPTWADLKFSTAFKAMFSLSNSAMHVTNYLTLNESDDCKKVIISNEEYKKLVQYVEKSFLKSKTGDFICIMDHYYGDCDAFYESKGSYSLFYTCNTWANEGLKYCGIKTCIWTPFDKGIFFHL